MAGPYGGTETIWGYAEESTFGTAIADTSNFKQLEGPVPGNIDLGMTRDQTVKFNGNRVPEAGNKYVTDTGGLKVIPFSDVIVRRLDLPYLLYAVMQVMDEGEASDYTKVLTFDATTDQPDFSNDEGLFLTVGIKDTIANFHQKYTSCILSELTLSFDPTGDGRLMASGNFVSGFAGSLTSNFNTGTWAFNTQNYFNMKALSTAEIGSAAVIVFGFSITIRNNAVVTGLNSSGYAANYTLAANNAGYNITGELTCLWDTVTDELISEAKAGTGSKIQIATGTGGSAGHFDITLDECHWNGDPTKNYTDERGQSITFPFIAMLNSGGTDKMAVLTVADGTDRSWPT